MNFELDRCFSLTKKGERCKRASMRPHGVASSFPTCKQHEYYMITDLFWYPFISSYGVSFHEADNEYSKMEKFIEFMGVYDFLHVAIDRCTTSLPQNILKTVLKTLELSYLQDRTFFREIFITLLCDFRKKYDKLEIGVDGACCVCYTDCQTTRNCCSQSTSGAHGRHNICTECYIKIVRCPICRREYSGK